jgi:hypothetical protein
MARVLLMRSRIRFLVLVVGVLLLAGCAGSGVEQVSTATLIASNTLAVTKTPVVSETLTPTASPSNTPNSKNRVASLRETGFVKLTKTRTVRDLTATVVALTPSLTPLPSLEPKNVDATFSNLWKNNSYCELPCFWGILPSQTTWEAAEPFLGSFSMSIEQGDRKNNHTNYTVKYRIPDTDQEGRVIFGVTNDIIDGIRIPSGNMNIKLHQMLSIYAKPETITIQTYPNSPINYIPFRIMLFYEDLGIFAYYEYEASKIGDSLVGCPMPVDPELYLWSPLREVTIESIEQFILGIIDEYPPNLEDVTNMNVSAFYESYKNPQYSGCIETPSEIWP